MEDTSEKKSVSATKPKTFMFKCPCKEKKCHLGVFIIVPKESEALSELSKVQKKFYLGHGIKTNDPMEAAKILLHRDHKILAALILKYCHGDLGVYMVPPMFYGQIPEAIKLSQFKVKKHLDGVKGDIAERKMFYALKDYFKQTGDDVLIIHSHKFFSKSTNKATNNEKDFIIVNLSKGEFYLFLKKPSNLLSLEM